MQITFKRIADRPTPAPLPTPKKAGRTPKWRWTVIFRDGMQIEVPSAIGSRDAVLQAMWTVRERTQKWPTWAVKEVRKYPTADVSGSVYMSYRNKND